MAHRRCRVVILEQYCKGCGLCIEFCKVRKLYIRQMPNTQGIQTAALRDDVDCTGCLQCATICPDAAIEVAELALPLSAGTERGARS